MIFIFLFLTYFICIIGSSFIHLIRADSNVFLLWLSNIPLCMFSLVRVVNKYFISFGQLSREGIVGHIVAVYS